MDVLKLYAENIKKFRRAKKFSQAELAEKIGLSVKYVSDLETGRSCGSLETLIAIAKALKIAPHELLMNAKIAENLENQKIQKFSHPDKRTRDFLLKMRTMYCDFVDLLEKFLTEDESKLKIQSS